MKASTMLNALRDRLQSLRAPDRVHDDISEEMRFHIQMRAEEYERGGLTPDQARRRAESRFGPLLQTREQGYDVRGGGQLEAIGQDVRYALRLLRKDAGFAGIVVATLALGIGATTAIFSLVNAVLLRPLPVRHPEQLAAVYSDYRGPDGVGDWSYSQYRDLRDRSGIFTSVAAQSGLDLNVTIGDRSQLVWGNIVSESYFSVLGMTPALGRLFLPEDDRGPGSDPIAILSYDAWQHRFAADPHVEGRGIRINGHPFTVIGVAPPGFHGTRMMGYWAEMWVPLMTYAQVMPGSAGLLEQSNTNWLLLIGRMPPGLTVGEAQARTATFARRLGDEQTGSRRLQGAAAIPAGTQFDNPSWVPRGTIVFASRVGLTAAVMVLLIACSNVANLLMARATARRKEIATRLALGATRGRLVRQMLTESFVLAALACPAGLALARVAQTLSAGLVPPGPFRLGFAESIDSNVVWFAVAASAATAFVFGLTPALRAARANVVPELKMETPAATVAGRRVELRSLLVLTQITFAAALLICGGLFLRSLGGARRIDVGFERENRFVMAFDLSIAGYDAARGDQFERDVLRSVRALPGVASASLVFPLPMDYEASSTSVFVAEKMETPTHETEQVWSSRADPGYFATMGTAIVAGREFSDQDDASAPPVVIVNETMARRFWPGGGAIGRELRVGGRTGKALRVIGVARDGKYISLGEPATPAMWTSLRQSDNAWVELVVHAAGESAAVQPAVRARIERMDPGVAIFGAQTIETYLKRALSLAETEAYMATTFAAMALLLSMLGLYGVISYSVAQRAREVGIRMALGARPGHVLRLVLRQALWLSAVGVAAGTLLGFALARGVAGMLYEVSAHDARVFIVTPLVLTAVALLAASVPARRATRVDPLRALRYE
jgi:putative ABC transport system permease protein